MSGMAYKNILQKAVEWGISTRRVRTFCREGRIPGAYRIDDKTGSWVIPEDAVRPAPQKTGRKKAPSV